MNDRSLMRARMYAPNLEVVGTHRILFWLSLDSWTLREAAMLFCDIDPAHAAVSDHGKLTGCSTMVGQSFDNRAPWVDLADPEVDSSDVGPWNIDGLADEFRDMEQRLKASADAENAGTTKAPVDWIRYAEKKRISIPWLVYAKEEVPDFPWPGPALRRVGLGVDRDTVMRIFCIRNDPVENKWWDGILSDVPLWLKQAIVQKGKGGVSHRWDVLGVAHAIFDRRVKRMTLPQLDRAIRGYSEDLFDKWRTETEFDRM